jgi:sugar (pentulose or hexulose) kinase
MAHHEVVGAVTRQAAAATGLSEGLPVFLGGGDQTCGTLGAGILDPGELGINGGTSCTNELLCNGLRPATRWIIISN